MTPPKHAIRAILVVLFFSNSAQAAPPQPLASWLPDAELTDVVFLDPDDGWAVGDRGVIWQTKDGGRHWERRESGVSARLEAIHFVDRQHGWIVGGWTLPYTQRSRGVVLRTTDGGQTWSPVSQLRIPRLNHVKFFDARQGWAVGETSTLYPTGVYRTEDGGRTWTTVVRGHSQPWLTGDFFGPQNGLVAGAGGTIAHVSRTQVIPSGRPPWGTRRLNCLRLTRTGTAWMVGAGGLLATSGDGGRAWHAPAGRLPVRQPGQFDFHDIAIHGDHCWIVGNPGSVVFHSPDQGRSWQRQNTKQSLPLLSVTFIDANRGWAVGALGTILATRDGGQTWQRQKSGGSRAGFLAFFAHEETAVYELFCLLSAEQGYLGVAQLVTTPSRGHGDMYARWRESVSLAGGSAAEQVFTLPRLADELTLNSERLEANWNRAVDGSYQELLDQRLVRSLRTWRPAVVVSEPGGAAATPIQQATRQAVQRAVKHAADATWYPDQLTEGGLSTWQVTRLAAVELERRPTTTLSTSQLVPRLGMSVAQFASRARSLTQHKVAVIPPSIGFSTLHTATQVAPGGRGLMAGSGLAVGGEGRRNINDSASEDVQSLVAASRRWRNMQQIMDRGRNGTISAVSLAGQLEDVLKEMPSTNGGLILFQLGHQYHRQGQLEMSAEVFQALLTRYPDHELVESAALELMHYYASGEVACQMRRSSGLVSGQVELAVASEDESNGGVQLASAVSDEDPSTGNQGGAVQARPRGLAVRETAEPGGGASERVRLAIELARVLQRDNPELLLSPDFRFPLSVAQRRFGMPRDAERTYHQLVGSRRDAWRQCAQQELWMLHGRGLPPKPTTHSLTTKERPRLDGQLDELCWQKAAAIKMKSPLADDESHPATALVAHDGQFLYLAARCQKAKDADYPHSGASRQRDTDLTSHDRIEWLLDMDRDYVSFYRLVIDHRGWANEDCWRDASWNPRWFIARSENKTSWTVEIAIPWNQLTSSPPSDRQAWAMSVQRIIPGVGSQSWTPRPGETGEQAGLLFFE